MWLGFLSPLSRIETHVCHDANDGCFVTNADLALLLNSELGLAGALAVTPNVIRQWVAWDVLTRSTATGRSVGESPEWSRSGKATRRAFRLAQLRKSGVIRENAVIVQVYIEWGHPDIYRVRQALLREVKKWRSQLLHRRTTRMGNADYQNLSAVQQRALRRQLGPLDARFAGTRFEQSDELYATLSELAESGEGSRDRISKLLLTAIDKVLPGIGEALPAESLYRFGSTIAGVFGSAEEIGNSAQSEIISASEREFRIARLITSKLLRSARDIQQIRGIMKLSNAHSELLQMLNFLSPQISAGVWASIQFTQCLMCVRRSHLMSGENSANLGNLGS